ncbi:MAG: SMC-Scp complex subunit ScpB [Elusimicrobiales bacterium]|jgi:segregation and condensation protein B
MEDTELRKALETLFFITDHPLPPERVAQLCEVKDLERVKGAIAALKEHLDGNGSALQLMQIAGGWQMATRPENGLWVRKLYHNKMTVRLSQAAIETLCIIAYRQPMTRAEIESVRGVEVIGPLDTLSERKLITVVGRRETVGRPILYGTTGEFLRQFGLNSLDDLPKLENIPVEDAPKQLVPQPEPAQPVLFEEAQPAASPEGSPAPEAVLETSGPVPAEERQEGVPDRSYDGPAVEPVAEGSPAEEIPAAPLSAPSFASGAAEGQDSAQPPLNEAAPAGGPSAEIDPEDESAEGERFAGTAEILYTAPDQAAGSEEPGDKK